MFYLFLNFILSSSLYVSILFHFLLFFKSDHRFFWYGCLFRQGKILPSIYLDKVFCFRTFHKSWNDLNWHKIYESRKKNSAFFVQVSGGSFVKKGCINTGRDDPTFLILSDEPKHEGMHLCTIVQLIYIYYKTHVQNTYEQNLIYV